MEAPAPEPFPGPEAPAAPPPGPAESPEPTTPSMFDPSTSNPALSFDAQAACVGLGGNAWTCFKKELPDSQIATSLWLWTAVGAAFMLLFCALLHLIPTYRTRLFLPNLWVDPPPLPTGAEGDDDERSASGAAAAGKKNRAKPRRSLRAVLARSFGWLVPVVTAPDAVVLESAGLDALVLCWTFKLGLQVFLPLAAVALFVLLPVNVVGQGVKQGVLSSLSGSKAEDATLSSAFRLAANATEEERAKARAAALRPGFTSFSRFTLTNLPQGSPLHWFAFAFVYLSTFWTLFLLRRYFRAYVLLRQKYVTGGEALLSAWHEAYLARAARAAEEAERAKLAGSNGAGAERSDGGATEAAATAAAETSSSSTDPSLPPLHPSPSSPAPLLSRGSGGRATAAAQRRRRGGSVSFGGGVGASSSSATAAARNSRNSDGSSASTSASRRSLGAALRGALGVGPGGIFGVSGGDDLLSAANDPGNASLAVAAPSPSAPGARSAPSSLGDDADPLSPRGGVASAAARAAGRLQQGRAVAPLLSVDVAAGGGTAISTATDAARPSSSPATRAASTAGGTSPQPPRAPAGGRGGSGDVATRSSPSLLASSSPTNPQRPRQRGPPSLSRVSVGAPGHFYYYSFPEAGVDLRGSGGGAEALGRRSSVGGGATRGRAAAAAAARSASGGLSSSPSQSPPPLLSLPPKPPQLRARREAAGGSVSLPTPFAAAAAASPPPKLSTFDDEGEEPPFPLQRAPPVSRYERDAPPPPPLAERPIQWWRSSAVASSADGDDGSGPSPTKSARKERRRERLSSHPCDDEEDVERGGDRSARPAEEGEEEDSEEEPQVVGKPNVRDRKLVPALSRDGTRVVAAPAEQYAVLVMDVPDLPAAAERARRWERGGAKRRNRVEAVMSGDGGAADDDDEGDERPPSSYALVRAATGAARSAGRFVKHVVLGKRRLAVSAEVMAAARERSRAAAAGLGASRGGDGRGTDGARPTSKAAAGSAAVEEARTRGDALPPATSSSSREPADESDDDKQRPQAHQQNVLLEDLLDEGVPIEPSVIVEETFRRLFPTSFRAAVPVHVHREVDLLLLRWDRACAALENAEARYEFEMARAVREGGSAEEARRPTMRARRRRKRGEEAERKSGDGGDDAAATAATPRASAFKKFFSLGERVDAIDHLARRVRALEAEIADARAAALSSRPTPSFFVFFDSQRDAAIAAQVNLQAEDGHSFTVVDAPGPEEVLWQTLWMPWQERDLRRLAVLPAIALLLLVPIGFFLGGASQITLFLCRLDGFRTGTGALCGSSFMRALTSILPPLLLSLWNGVILPKLLYWLALAEGKSASLSALDRRICDVYFLFDVVNVFLGTVLGGSLFNSLRAMLSNPASVLRTLGAAAPTVSSFWMNFLILQAAALVPSRFLFPHPGVLGDLWRKACGGARRAAWWCSSSAKGAFSCCCGSGKKRRPLPPLKRPRSAHAKMDRLWPHSIRYGKEIGAALLIFVVALSYAPLSPPVSVLSALYFCVSWLFWRYSVMYVYERAYESGGRLFPHVVRSVLWALFLSEALVGLVFVSRGAYAQATLLWFVLTPIIYSFGSSVSRYGRAVDRTPLEAADGAPRAEVEAIVYTPPALRPRSAGWWPESGKTWEGWGAPLYTI